MPGKRKAMTSLKTMSMIKSDDGTTTNDGMTPAASSANKSGKLEKLRSMYRVNQLVWVKKSGYPWWPAQVVDPDKLETLKKGDKVTMPKTAICMVVFFDANMTRTSVTKTDQILPYFQHYDQKCHGSKKADFKWALDEAKKYGTSEIRQIEDELWLNLGSTLADETTEASVERDVRKSSVGDGNCSTIDTYTLPDVSSQESAVVGDSLAEDPEEEAQEGDQIEENDEMKCEKVGSRSPIPELKRASAGRDADDDGETSAGKQISASETQKRRRLVTSTPERDTTLPAVDLDFQSPPSPEMGASVGPLMNAAINGDHTSEENDGSLTIINGAERQSWMTKMIDEPIGIIGLSEYGKALIDVLITSGHANILAFAMDENERNAFRDECEENQCDVIVYDNVIQLLDGCRLLIDCCASGAEVEKVVEYLSNWERGIPGSIRDEHSGDWGFIEMCTMDSRTVASIKKQLTAVFATPNSTSSSFGFATAFLMDSSARLLNGDCTVVGGGDQQLIERVLPLLARCGVVCYGDTPQFGCSLASAVSTVYVHQLAGAMQMHQFLKMADVDEETVVQFRNLLRTDASDRLLNALTSGIEGKREWLRTERNEWIRRLQATVETAVTNKADVTFESLFLQKLRRMKEGNM